MKSGDRVYTSAPARAGGHVDRTTSWVTIHFDLEDFGPKEPFRIESIVDAGILTLGRRPTLPPIIPEGTELPS